MNLLKLLIVLVLLIVVVVGVVKLVDSDSKTAAKQGQEVKEPQGSSDAPRLEERYGFTTEQVDP